jgi:predicted lipid-binding transport protein (Tim44 family)
MISPRSPFARAAIVAIAALFLTAGLAEARAGRGGGFGSRGARTFQAPPPTKTAPTPAQPIQRSTTPQPSPGANQAAPGAGVTQPARPGFFSGRGGFMGGLIGAGLLGMLLGYGLFGGLGSLASIIGLLLQVALVVILVRFAIGFFQRRNQPAYAGVGAVLVAGGAWKVRAPRLPNPPPRPARASAWPAARNRAAMATMTPRANGERGEIMSGSKQPPKVGDGKDIGAMSRV